ncbi:glycosyltransferase family 4 protein [Hansschlegelia sp. KR7-227]|uniref:glycosyltransferase family 4 protein n=1 Tax=Hansschlegelia sp. KR7-227 TaxID=3400914 RepID=UPI003C09FD4C
MTSGSAEIDSVTSDSAAPAAGSEADTGTDARLPVEVATENEEHSRTFALTDSELLLNAIDLDWYIVQVSPSTQRTIRGADSPLEHARDHYLHTGSPAGLSPIRSFSPTYYRGRYQAELGEQEPLVHYLRSAAGGAFVPHPLLAAGAPLGLGGAMTEHASPLFDARHYYKRYPDVLAAGADGLLHYFLHGSGEGRQAHPLFDASYYLAQQPDEAAFEDPYLHYLTVGWRDGRSPHWLFDVAFYASQFPEYAELGVSPLEHYVTVGAAQRARIHPLFDVDYYADRAGLDEDQDPFVHFVTIGTAMRIDPHPMFDTAYAESKGYSSSEGAFRAFLLSPFSGSAIHPLFDVTHYVEVVTRDNRTLTNPLTDYLTVGMRKGLSPHVLFDHEHYAEQLPEDERPRAGLLHYLTEGWRSGLSPHPLFDPQCYCRFAPRPKRSVSPLVEYVTEPFGKRPHALFDENHYRYASGLSGATPGLQAYLNAPNVADLSTHPLFDPGFYVWNVGDKLGKLRFWRRESDLKRLLRDLDSQAAAKCPLLHYATIGWKFGISTSRSFDAEFYARGAGLGKNVDLLRHYLVDGGMTKHSPHPAIDLEYYKTQAIGFDPSRVPVYAHLISQPKGRRPQSFRMLDVNFYQSNNRDIAQYNLCGIDHFITFGMREGRPPNAFFSSAHINQRYADNLMYDQTAMWEYCARNNGDRRPKVLFVGHDATRTGAPLILLRIIEGLTDAYDLDAYCILGSGGELFNEFRASSHCYVMKHGLDRPFLDGGARTPEWQAELQSALACFGPGGPDLVVCNTAETRAFMDCFAKLGLPVVSLVHEQADFFDSAQFGLIYESSAVTIFPSEYTRSRAAQKTPFGDRPVAVRGQGLLDPGFGSLSRGVARATALEELRLPPDARLVVGCGVPDTRKGIDLFVETASRVFSDPRSGDMPFYFIWIGGHPGHSETNSWARRRIEQLGLAAKVRFVGPKADPEPYYRASDLFLMTSRMDPFPCVIHEAMACGLPVIAFEGCSGAPEAFGASGVVVPAEDTQAMAETAIALLSDAGRLKSLGDQAKAIVAEKWRYVDYVRDLADLIAVHVGLRFEPRVDPAAAVVPTAPAIAGSAARKTVYFSSPDWGISGVNTFTANLIEGLNERGFDARLLFTNGRFSFLPPTEMMPNLPVTFLPVERHHFTDIWSSLTKLLRAQRPCIYVPNYDYIGSAVSPIVHPNVGIVGIAHSDDVEHYEHVDRLGRYWDRIISVSHFIEREIGELNPAFSAKTVNIYYGVPFDEAAARRRVDARSYDPGLPLVMTYSGRMVTQQKNVHAFIELAERLQNERVPFVLNLLGDGDQYDHLRWKLGGFVDAGVVRMPGRVTPEDVDRALDESDAFVLLSDFEGLPLSMLEAMAKGVIPVIRDMKSGIPEVITSGTNGFITARHDIGAMVEVLRDLQANPEQRRALGHAVIDSFIAHRLSQSAMSDAYAEVFEGVFEELKDRPKPRAKPLAHNAPIYGVAAPPFLYRKD